MTVKPFLVHSTILFHQAVGDNHDIHLYHINASLTRLSRGNLLVIFFMHAGNKLRSVVSNILSFSPTQETAKG